MSDRFQQILPVKYIGDCEGLLAISKRTPSFQNFSGDKLIILYTLYGKCAGIPVATNGLINIHKPNWNTVKYA